MKKSLEASSKDAEATANEAALAEIGEDALAPVADTPVSLAIGQVSGDVDQRDVIIPKLGITQSVGPLSETFTPGDLVLNSETLLAPADTDIELIVLSIKKSYEEKLPYDPDGPMPRRWDTAAEVAAAGLWTEWRNNEPPPARELGTALVLIKQPEDVTSHSFTVPIGDDSYAAAMWIMRSTAYSRAAKKIFTASRMQLAKTGLLSGVWSLKSHRTKVGANMIFVPVLAIAAISDEDKTKEILNCMSDV